MLEETGKDLRLVLELLIAALGGLLRLVDAALHHFDVRHDELEVDDVDIALRVCPALDVDDVLVIEAADDVDNRVGRADVREEFVAEALALRRALDETRNVNKLDDGGGLLLGLIELGEPVEPLVRHGDHADVRVDGAEGIIRGLGARVGDGIKERGLADVGQPDDT